MAHPVDTATRHQLFEYLRGAQASGDFFAWFFADAWGHDDLPAGTRDLISTIELAHAEWTSGDRDEASVRDELWRALLLVEVDAVHGAGETHEAPRTSSGTGSRMIALTMPPPE